MFTDLQLTTAEIILCSLIGGIALYWLESIRINMRDWNKHRVE